MIPHFHVRDELFPKGFSAFSATLPFFCTLFTPSAGAVGLIEIKIMSVLFSIITINRNNCDGLLRTIESVVAQTYADFEYIVVDGASTDGSAELLIQYKECITVGISEPDTGIYEAMNKGVRYATGRYCIFLNSGDLLADREVLGRLATLPLEADVVSGDAVMLNKKREVWKSPQQVSLLFFMREGSLNHQATLIKRTVLLSYPYDEKKRIVSDWKFFVEVLVIHSCSYQHIDMTIVQYDTTGISANSAFSLLVNKEIGDSLKELIPERILCDYEKMAVGDTPFMKFMIRISRNKKYAALLYHILYPLTKLYCRIFHKQLLRGL